MERHGSLTGYRNGWAMESLETPLLEEKDEGRGKCDVYVNLTGWDRVETHVRFMETEDFRDNQHWFVGVEGLRGAEIVHVRFWEVSGN